MRVWVAAGGTGGHLYPALAVADELGAVDPSGTLWFAVSRRGLEERVLAQQDRSPSSTAWRRSCGSAPR